MKKKLLIAGGSGFLGTTITSIAINNNYNVTSTYFSKIKNKNLKRFYKKYDFTKFNDCLLATKNKDCLIMCAMVSSGLKLMSEKKVYDMVLKNIIIRSNIFEACRINNIKNIVWVSSSTVYQPAKYPIKEKQLNLNLEPYSIYQSIGWGYRYIEKLAEYYNQNYNLNIKIIRTSNIYGPYDNFNESKSHVIPALIKRALKNENPFIVWGNRKTVRDFVYSEDLAKAIIKLLKIKKLNSPLNFSSGIGCSIEELSKKVLKVSKCNSKIKFDKSKPTSADYRVLDNKIANKILSIKTRTKLETGLMRTIDWYLNN